MRRDSVRHLVLGEPLCCSWIRWYTRGGNGLETRTGTERLRQPGATVSIAARLRPWSTTRNRSATRASIDGSTCRPATQRTPNCPVPYLLHGAPVMTKGLDQERCSQRHSRQSHRRQEDRPHDRGHAQRLCPGAEARARFLAGTIMKRADADKNGIVSREEFIAAAGAAQGNSTPANWTRNSSPPASIVSMPALRPPRGGRRARIRRRRSAALKTTC